jgi:signal transduction histidine kinase
LFAIANWVAMANYPDWETIPFHFIWISLTLVYGFRVWGRESTTFVLLTVIAVTGALIFMDALNGSQLWGELFEVPLMSSMFLAMVWHATRRESALAEVEIAADRQREFVRDASHQIKTPIAVCRALATVIQQSENEPAAQRKMDVADLVDELERLSRVAEELLTLASTNPRDLVLAPVELEDVVVSAVARWSRRVERTWAVDVQGEGVIDGDRMRLDQALDAILDNATKATAPGDTIQVTVTETANDKAVIVVRDSGHGMEPDDARRVFDRFWTHPYGRGAKRGTGLGLAIVKAVAEAHGGTAQFTTEIEKGSSVRITLPGLRPAMHALVLEPVAAPSARAASPSRSG